MEQSSAFFFSHLSIGIAEHELDGFEEITLSGAIAPDDDIMAGREGFGDRLFFVAGSN